jgi:hypothetical protein
MVLSISCSRVRIREGQMMELSQFTYVVYSVPRGRFRSTCTLHTLILRSIRRLHWHLYSKRRPEWIRERWTVLQSFQSHCARVQNGHECPDGSSVGLPLFQWSHEQLIPDGRLGTTKMVTQTCMNVNCFPDVNGVAGCTWNHFSDAFFAMEDVNDVGCGTSESSG